MKRAIVVGTGAGGATAAKELQGTYDVTVLEAGKSFTPFTTEIERLEKWKRTGLFLDERLISILFPAMRIVKTSEKMVLVRGTGTGGTTTLSAGNALRMDQHLREMGIDLDEEFDEIYREIPVSAGHQKQWHRITRQLFETCREMGLSPQATPKLVDFSKCTRCGRCVFGCPQDAKWDSRRYLSIALSKGARLLQGCRVESIAIHDGHASGVIAKTGLKRQFIAADLIIIAAGGFCTPIILQNSGITCENSLFVDPVLCVAAEMRGVHHQMEIQMPFVVQMERFMVSPYFDYLSFFFDRRWRFPAPDTLSLMIKLADANIGSVTANGVNKTLTEDDTEVLRNGVTLCSEILRRVGVKASSIFLGTINAGHPGGTLPLTKEESRTMHSTRLPANVFVADASLFPRPLGNPPILTIIALAKKVSRVCRQLTPGF
jgi:choline dehydrogenase-like flavoprotein